MNGPLKMYLAKPIIRHDLPVELPDCMYKMKNIHTVGKGTVITDTGHVSTTRKENLDTFDQVIQFLKKNQIMPDMAALIARQEQILLQLADLKKQMLSLKENLRATTSSRSTTVETAIPKFDANDVVINVSPLNPPYFLEVLQKLWNQCVNLCIKSYLHSSVADIPEQAKTLVTKLESFSPTSDRLPQLTIRIIWKEVGPHAELVVLKTPILGEVNILRYLARTTCTLNYEMSHIFELDSILDTCYALIQAKTKTDRNSAMHILNKKLGKSQWLCGQNQCSIADVAAYSALKQISQNEINVNLTKWLLRCECSFC